MHAASDATFLRIFVGYDDAFEEKPLTSRSYRKRAP